MLAGLAQFVFRFQCFGFRGDSLEVAGVDQSVTLLALERARWKFVGTAWAIANELGCEGGHGGFSGCGWDALKRAEDLGVGSRRQSPGNPNSYKKNYQTDRAVHRILQSEKRRGQPYHREFQQRGS